MGVPFLRSSCTLHTIGIEPGRGQTRRTGFTIEKSPKEKESTMNQVRGILLIAAGGFALYEGWKIHSGSPALWAYSLGVVAIGLGFYRLLRKPPEPLG
jgi:hypothetical protein